MFMGEMRGSRTCSFRCMFSDFADQLWDSRPVALAPGTIQLLDVVHSLCLEGGE